MAGHTFRTPCNFTHFIFTVWLLIAWGAESTRVGMANHDAEEQSEVGAACVELNNKKRKDILSLTKAPPQVQILLERRNAIEEYHALAETLYQTKQGTNGAWKCSHLYRGMYIRGHEQAFKAKNVSIYITKDNKKVLKSNVGSTKQVCFVDRIVEPAYMPPDIYNDGKKQLWFKKGSECMTQRTACDQLGKLPEGVYGQIYDNFPHFLADKSTMPVDLLKFLEKKNAMHENVEMAARLNLGFQTGFNAAQIVENFKKQFRVKGIALFYSQMNFTQDEWHHEWHHWFEYADIDVVGEAYKPNINGVATEYPRLLLKWSEECKNGDTRNFAKYLALYSGQEYWGSCGDVAAAEERERSVYPDCKCKDKDHSVYCGDKFVADRKFDIKSVLSTEGCGKRRAYCSSKPCLMPTWPRP